MRNLTATLCLTTALLLGSVGCSSENEYTGKNAYLRGDYSKALRVLKDNQTAIGQEYLGKMYLNGQGVEKDYGKAIRLFVLAGNQGNMEAQFQAGLMNEKGLGIPQNNKNALDWYTLAAKQGHPDAARHIKDLQMKRLKETCSEVGFKDGSKEFSTCMFELYKLNKSKSQTQTVIQNNTGDNSAVRALLEEQRKQRQLEGSLELMKRGFEMMNPPKPKLTCKYNTFTKTTVCN